jgi:ADP-heptose:LPS heptosyltransferase
LSGVELEGPGSICVLVQQNAFLGDVLVLYPLFHGLREHFPGRRLVVISKHRNVAILRDHGLVDDMIIAPRVDWSLWRALRRERPALFISLRRQSMGANLVAARLGGAERSLGFDSGPNRQIFTDVVPPVTEGRYRAFKYTSMLEALGAPVDLEGSVRRMLVGGAWERPATRGPLFCCMPGGSRDEKQWGIDHFLELAERLVATHEGAHWVYVIGDRERELGFDTTIAESSLGSRIELLHQPPLSDIARIGGAADLVVANDCGPAHIAQMIGSPMVMLFGNWDGLAHERVPFWFWARKGSVCLTPRDARPLRSIPVDTVFDAAEEVLVDPASVGPEDVRRL